MKKIITLVFSMLLIIPITYANNILVSTDNIQPQCVETGNVEVRVVDEIMYMTKGYKGLEISMNNKNDYMVNITIYLTVDGTPASKEYYFVLDAKENRIERLYLRNPTEGLRCEVYYKFSVTKCY